MIVGGSFPIRCSDDQSLMSAEPVTSSSVKPCVIQSAHRQIPSSVTLGQRCPGCASVRSTHNAGSAPHRGPCVSGPVIATPWVQSAGPMTGQRGPRVRGGPAADPRGGSIGHLRSPGVAAGTAMNFSNVSDDEWRQ